MAEPVVPLRNVEPPPDHPRQRGRARRLLHATRGHIQRLPHAADKVGTGIAVLRSFAVNLAMIVGVAIGGTVAIDQLRYRALVIEPIPVPEALADLGHTPEGVARRLKERIQAVLADETLQDLLDRLAVWDELPELVDAEIPDVQIPETGIALSEVLSYVQQLLGRTKNRIAGEITGDEEIGYELRLWAKGGDALGEVGKIDGKEQLGSLFELGARRILSDAEPYLYAVYQALRAEPDADAGILALITAALEDERVEDNASARYLQGVLLMSKNDLDGAIAAFERAIGVEPKLAIAHANLGFALTERAIASAAAAQQEFQSQRRELDDKGLAEAQDRFIARRNAAQQEFKKGLDKLSAAAMIDDDVHGIFFFWGTALYNSGAFDEAAKLFGRAAELDSDHWPTLRRLGCALILSKKENEGFQVLDDAKRLAPEEQHAAIASAKSSRCRR